MLMLSSLPQIKLSPTLADVFFRVVLTGIDGAPLGYRAASHLLLRLRVILTITPFIRIKAATAEFATLCHLTNPPIRVILIVSFVLGSPRLGC
jgi:hypothetical protein